MNRVHKTAIVDERAELGDGVEIGPFSIIHGNVRIGANSVIGSHCELGIPTPLSNGTPLVIGDNSIIRSHSIFYESSSFGERLVTGHRVTVREGVKAGVNLQIGTLSDLQGDCQIGSHTRFHSNVHIGKKSVIGNFVWVFPYVVLTNDPTPPSETLIGVRIEDYAVVATMSVVLPGVTVGTHALVGAHACVGRDVPPYSVVAGVPAKVVAQTRDLKLKDGSGNPAYPWTSHFHRGYPNAAVMEWLADNHELPWSE